MLGIIVSWLGALMMIVRVVVGEVIEWQRGRRCRACGGGIGVGKGGEGGRGMGRFCDDCGVEGVMMREAEVER